MPKKGGKPFASKAGGKGGKRVFTNFEELEAQKEKQEKMANWRKTREDGESDEEESGSSEEESSSGEEEEQARKPSGVEGFIDIQNPNRAVSKMKKLNELDGQLEQAKPELSRREREEVERQQSAARYRKLHAMGKTEEARSDMARLAVIRKQREEAQKRKEDEQNAKTDATAKRN